MEIAYEDDYLFLQKDTAKSLYVYSWKPPHKDLSLEEFSIKAAKILEVALESNIKYVIANGPDFALAIPPELQEELNKNLLHKINGTIIKKVAHVVARDIFSQVSVSQLFDENIKKTYQEKYFDSYEEAEEWVLL